MTPKHLRFGRRIRDARLRLGLTGVQLGRLLVTSGASVSRWEHGRTRPIGLQALLIDAILRVSTLDECDIASALRREGVLAAIGELIREDMYLASIKDREPS